MRFGNQRLAGDGLAEASRGSFRKIAFFGPDTVVLRPVYEYFDFAPFSVVRALGWPVADLV